MHRADDRSRDDRRRQQYQQNDLRDVIIGEQPEEPHDRPNDQHQSRELPAGRVGMAFGGNVMGVLPVVQNDPGPLGFLTWHADRNRRAIAQTGRIATNMQRLRRKTMAAQKFLELNNVPRAGGTVDNDDSVFIR